MIENRINENMQKLKKSLPTFLICATGIAILVFLAILPASNYSGRLGLKIKELQFQLGIQRSLMPLYSTLNMELKQMETKALPFPGKTRLEKDKIDVFYDILRDIAKESNMEVHAIVPNLESVSRNPGFLSVFAVFKGDYFDFRKLLTHVGGIPYLEHIGSIDIQQTKNAKEFKINLWIRIS